MRLFFAVNAAGEIGRLILSVGSYLFDGVPLAMHCRFDSALPPDTTKTGNQGSDEATK